MREQHLSDEAVAAYADGALNGIGRERARQHTAHCPECANYVAAQREAAWTLRTAAVPQLPSGLMDRLRAVPSITPIRTPNTSLAADGSTLLATFGSLAPTGVLAAFHEPPAAEHTSRRSHVRPVVGAVAAVALAGVVTVSSAAQSSAGPGPWSPSSVGHGRTDPAVYTAVQHAHR